MVRTIYVDNEGKLQFADDILAYAINLVQCISLEKGEDRFYSQTGVPWLYIAQSGQDPVPYINGAIQYSYPSQFITKVTTVEKNKIYNLSIQTAPNQELINANVEVPQ
jgi:hypothetical protein